MFNLILQLIVSSFIVSAFHQIGHIVAGRISGYTVTNLIIGIAFVDDHPSGDTVYWPVKSITIGNWLRFGISLFPFGGHVFFQESFKQMITESRLKACFMLLGGIMGNAVCVFVAYVMFGIRVNGIQNVDLLQSVILTGKAIGTFPVLVFQTIWNSIHGMAPGASPKVLFSSFESILVLCNAVMIWWNLMPVYDTDSYISIKALFSNRNEL